MFSRPSPSTLESYPMGRGTVLALKGENGKGLGSDCGRQEMVAILITQLSSSILDGFDKRALLD